MRKNKVKRKSQFDEDLDALKAAIDSINESCLVLMGANADLQEAKKTLNGEVKDNLDTIASRSSYIMEILRALRAKRQGNDVIDVNDMKLM